RSLYVRHSGRPLDGRAALRAQPTLERWRRTMMRSRLFRSLLLCSIVLSLVSAVQHASAGQFTKLVVFGDSLSDTGNVYAVTAGAVPPSPPYYAGRFSNGPVWAEYLAAALALPAVNYAY